MVEKPWWRSLGHSGEAVVEEIGSWWGIQVGGPGGQWQECLALTSQKTGKAEAIPETQVL